VPISALATPLAALLLVLNTDVAGAGTAAKEQAPVTSLTPPNAVTDHLDASALRAPAAPEVPLLATAVPLPEPAPLVVEEPPAEPAPAPAPPAAWPLDRGAPITDGFGPRVAPAPGASTFHRGIDFAAPEGAPVYAAADGLVTEVVAHDSGACGVEVVITHIEAVGAVSTRYCHLQEGSVAVTVGTHLGAGHVIAAVGNTGVSTGAHLHFEVRLPGGEAIDPVPWLEHHTAA
jgi:murein DD-endopeptidase MepM/ murein hydrolase activator NlpD